MAISCSIFTEAGHCAGKTRVSPASQSRFARRLPGKRDAWQSPRLPQRRNDSMRQRVSLLAWSMWLAVDSGGGAAARPFAFGANVCPADAARGQPNRLRFRKVPPTRPARLTDAIRNMLTKGRTLESNGRWAEALTYYEEALREYPQDRALQDRFDVARLHYSLEQRYDDRSFQDSVKTLRPQQALDLYGDLLGEDQRPLLHHAAVAGFGAARRPGDGHRPGRRKLPCAAMGFAPAASR